MRISTFLIALAASTAITQAAETVFESPLTTLEDVNKWEVIDSNNDDYTWAWDDYFELLCCSTVNADMAADDWLISPPITVEAGMYMLQFDLRCSTSGEKIDIFYGNEATIDAMDNMLLDITDDDGSFITHTKMFTVENSGTIYLGFHAKSDAWSYQISLRNVKLSTSEGKDLKAVSISGLQSGYRLDAQQVKFTICNNGAADVSNFEVCYRINDGLSFGETVNRTLRPGETYEHSFAILADVSTPGDYKLEAWTALEGDELPGNDKVSTEFRHCVITDGPYSTSFETEDINSDIIYLDLNEDPADEENGDWHVTEDDGWFSNFARTGTHSLCYFYSRNHPGDDWAFMPAMHLTPGYYAVKFWYCSDDSYPENMKLCYGQFPDDATTPTPEMMNMTIIDLPGAATSEYTESVNVVHITTEGDYIFGFYCYSEADSNTLAVDDFSVAAIENTDADLAVTLLSPSSDYMVQGASTENIIYSITNNGITEMTGTHIAISIDGEIIAEDDIASIPAQATVNYAAPGLANLTGKHTVKVEISNSADTDASNNSAERSVKLVANAAIMYDFEPETELEYGEIPQLPDGIILRAEDGGTVNTGLADIFPNNEAWNFVEINTHEIYGEWMLAAASWLDGADHADRWCIFPPVKINGSDADAVWASNSGDENFPETYEVLISTTGTETADFTKVLTVENEPGQPSLHGIDLSQYEGQQIYFAIRLTTADGYFLTIDNVGFYGNVASGTSSIDNALAANGQVITTRDAVTYTGTDAQGIAIYDLGGRIVASTTQATVSTSQLPRSVYVAVVTTSNGKLAQKFVK